MTDAGKPFTGRDYYEKVMKPILDSDKQIIYIGEVDSTQKKLWYQQARATLFPIQWGEPFGLVLIESMACGTPVLAYNKGSVPEIVIHGKTGFVVDTIDEMIKAVRTISLIDPIDCRNHIKENFSVASMAGKYSQLYQSIVDEGTLYPIKPIPVSNGLHPCIIDRTEPLPVIGIPLHSSQSQRTNCPQKI